MRNALKLALLAGLTLLAAGPQHAQAAPYAPPAGQVFQGINDTAVSDDFDDFAALVGKPHLPIVQAFHTWGTDPSEALARWEGYRVRGVISISTAPGYGLPGTISPRSIAQGSGDDYLLTLNEEIARSGRVTYLRPLAEMNNGHNGYAPYTAYGASRGPDYSSAWYRQAWKRIYLIVHGGGTSAAINAKLAAIGLPPIKRVDGHVVPAQLAAPSVALIWCPLAVSGSPNIAGLRARNFWPGPEYVDWVGTDTYSKYPAFSRLSEHYRSFRGRPFAIGEWGIWDADSPGFVRRLFRWQRRHPRVRMMIYHMSFSGRENPLSLYRYPRATVATKRFMRGMRFPSYAPEWIP